MEPLSLNSIESRTTPRISARTESSIVVLATLAFLAIAWTSVKHQSITVDEVVHIPAGLSYLQQQDGRMNLEHPPLVKILAAVPLLFQRVRFDYSRPEWRATFDAHFGEEELARF